MEINLNISIEEQKQLFTACWNERARVEQAIKNRKESGVISRCSLHERSDLLTSLLNKLKV